VVRELRRSEGHCDEVAETSSGLVDVFLYIMCTQWV